MKQKYKNTMYDLIIAMIIGGVIIIVMLSMF